MTLQLELMTYSDKEETMTPEKKQARLEALRKKHRTLDSRIDSEYKLHMDVAQLKSEKLRMKQEIYSLERELGDNG